MKKIAFLVNSLAHGGGEKIVSTIINELSKNIEIELILLENDIFYKTNQNIKITKLNTKIKIKSNILKFLSIPFTSWKLAKYIKENKLEVVNSHLYRANYINVLAKYFGAKHKCVITNHGDPFQYSKKGFLGQINTFLIKKLYPKADLVISISKVMKHRILKIAPLSNIVVINNPYDFNTIIELSNQEVNFQFDKNKKYLICMGRLIKLKRISDIIISLSKLDKYIELIILGDGTEKINLENLAKKHLVYDRIHFIGNVENPFSYLAKSDIFILSSESEGFPNSLIESMICKLPVISTDCISGPREILAPKTNINVQLKDTIEVAEYGILYPVGNIEKLIESIKFIFDNNDSRIKLINNSNIRAKDFQSINIVKKYKKVLEIE